jgi:hypothetical protein
MGRCSVEAVGPVPLAQGDSRAYTSTVPSGDKAVQQIVEALTNASMKLAQDYGPWIVCAVLLLVGGGVGLRIVARLLRRNPTRPPV